MRKFVAAFVLAGFFVPAAGRAGIVADGPLSYTGDLSGVISNGTTVALDLTNPSDLDGSGASGQGNTWNTNFPLPYSSDQEYGPMIALGEYVGSDYHSDNYVVREASLQSFFGLLELTNPGQYEGISFLRGGQTVGSIALDGVGESLNGGGGYEEYLNANVAGGYDEVVVSTTPDAAIYGINIQQSRDLQDLSRLDGQPTSQVFAATPVPEPALPAALVACAGAALLGFSRRRSRGPSLQAA